MSWSAWINLGGYVLGSPAVLYDSLSRNFEVYAVGRDHALLEKAWNPSMSWSAWINLGGVFITI
jgi:hypothetical protein